ncbi:chloride channel protein [Mycolicibacterium komossense]|uniref:Chloride channel protein n=1 Tax=Mycolicibacterium komossense TaxID=1779 RepID=A0ABT3CJC5_9MYCO|nr:chloride channel protein [Mycolicibacterium komossense]MCV7229556.1 chloride channel protein [Mycolicibacterium komossense]
MTDRTNSSAGSRILAARRAAWGRWLRGSPSALVPLAVAVGAVTGLGAVGFRWLITAFTRMFTGYADYSGLGRVASTHWPWLGFWFLLLAPVVAGAVYGPLVHRFAPEARGHGVPEVMYAVSHRGGRIAPQVSLVKALASALCIGGGGSVGREGPIVQIGSAAGSTVAQLLRLDTPRVRLLVACGAAAGISATFNAPLAGPFFALELILRSFTAESFGAVVLASVTADVVGRTMLGDHPFLTLPIFAARGPVEYLLYIALGVAVGVVGVIFSKVLYLVEDACDWVWRGPEWARPAVGGILLGGLLIALPQMYGVGYPVLENAVEGKYVIGMLLLLMVGKMLATSLTIGIGGSGGVFAPTLFIGAMAGTAFGLVAHDLFPGVTESAGAYGLIGMGAALGGATGAPITAVIILFELTGEYSIILPLMAAVVMAAGTGHLLSKNTIYTAKLWRRGVDLDAAPSEHRDFTAADIAIPAPEPLSDQASLAAAAAALATSPFGMLPVIGADGRYTGCVSAQDVAEALRDTDPPPDLRTLVGLPAAVVADAAADEILAKLGGRGGTGLPVLNSGHTELIGWITYESVLAKLRPATPAASEQDP